MKEILEKNGFEDRGVCTICGGNAWNFVKIVNGKGLVEVKVRIAHTLAGPKEAGHCNIYCKGGFAARAQKENLEIVLRANGFIE
jgi:hypothetical protein